MSRQIQIVYRRLGNKALGSSQLSSAASSSRSHDFVHAPIAQAGGSVSKFKHPPVLSHWAIAVQTWVAHYCTPACQQEEDRTGQQHWHYYGLVTGTGKLCVLDTATFNSLGNEASRYGGVTSHAPHEVLLFAQRYIDETGDYDLINNNCQDFAISLLFRVADYVYEQDRMLEKMNKAVLRLVKTKVDKATSDISVYDRKDVLLNVVRRSAPTG